MPDSLRHQLQSAVGAAYSIEGELTGGSMSRVFIAHELALGRRVVVKALSPDFAAAVNAKRFRREIRLAPSLQQANIVPVLATGEIDGLPYSTMPLVDGESLRAPPMLWADRSGQSVRLSEAPQPAAALG